MRATTPSPLMYLTASRQCEIANLRNLLHTGHLTAIISQLIHELQRERGASNIWLCSQGRMFGDELPQRARQVSQIIASMMAKLPAIPSPENASQGRSRVFSRIASAIYALSELPALRDAIRQFTLSHAQAMAQFNHIIRQLLNLAFEMIDTASDPEVSRALIAMFSFIQGKELAGQERATGSAGYAAGEFSQEQSERMVALIGAQERCFSSFSQFADEENLQRWRSIATCDSDVERLRRIACTRTTPEAGGTEMALRWYQLMTRRIDGLKVIEDGLAHHLTRCCHDSIRRAETRREEQEEDIHQAVSGLENRSAYSVYVAGRDGFQQEVQQLDSGGLTPQLGRSVLELVQAQSERLQAQDNELAAMRATLNERKQIDQAKVLLMRHHNYNEEQAWQTLRKMAMDQNRRIADVAIALLSVAAAFTSRAE